MSFTQLEFDDPNFWSVVRGATTGNNIGKFKTDAGLYFVTLRNTAVPQPIVRTKEEYFSATLKAAQKKDKLRVVINAQLYGMTARGKADYAWGDDAVDAQYITPEGRMVANSNVLVGAAAPLMFHMKYKKGAKPPYSFGFGKAPTDADFAVGGAGPIIVNGRPYASTNVYDSRVPTGAPRTGEPGDKYNAHLLYRSNATYASLSSLGARIGKVIFAQSQASDIIMVVVQQDGVANRQLNDLRNFLVALKFENAIFFDGSNSALLMVDDKLVIQAAQSKDMTNVSGIGFKYE